MNLKLESNGSVLLGGSFENRSSDSEDHTVVPEVVFCTLDGFANRCPLQL